MLRFGNHFKHVSRVPLNNYFTRFLFLLQEIIKILMDFLV
jgi:hypothetical protein